MCGIVIPVKRELHLLLQQRALQILDW